MTIQLILTMKEDLLTTELTQEVGPAFDKIRHLIDDVKVTQSKEVI